MMERQLFRLRFKRLAQKRGNGYNWSAIFLTHLTHREHDVDGAQGECLILKLVGLFQGNQG